MVSIARRSRYRLFAAFLAFLFLLEPLLPAVAWAAEPVPLDAAAATLVEAHPLGARELPEKRSATSREFLLPDGSHQVEVFLDPVNYQDAAGAWQPFQRALEVSQKPGFALENQTNTFAAYFGADGAGGGVVRVEREGVALEMRPVLSSLTADTVLPTPPKLLQDQVVYLDTFPGVSLRYETRPGALKETIVLADAAAPTSFEFRLSATGLTPRTNVDGSISFLDAAGETAFLLPRPWVTDSAPGAPVVDLEQTLRAEGDGYLLSVSLDPAWLADPARVFPVLIDPTIETQAVALDTFLSPTFPTTSYGTQTTLRVGNDTAYGDTRSLVKFTLPTLTEFPQIQQASLSLYKEYPGQETGQNTIEAYRVTSSWGSTVTYATSPTFASTPDSATPADGAGGWYAFDVTPSVAGWYGSSSNYGLLLKSLGGVAGSARLFRSMEYADTAYKPKLTIVYAAGDPRHTSYDLGEFAGHQAAATLDRGRLNLRATDLAIASFGPRAALDRYYSSTKTLTGVNAPGWRAFAPGWRFSFERNLSFVSADQTDYIDEWGEVHSFFLSGTTWVAPQGFFATLTYTEPFWYLTLKDGRTLSFTSSGGLRSEADRNGNTVTYYWRLGQLQITAANGQLIHVMTNGFDRITSATYTVDGQSRQVTYTTAAPWQVTSLAGAGALEHSATFTYDYSNRLTELKATAYNGADAKETFLYTREGLTEVRFPAYASSTPLYNASNTDARAVFAYAGASATVTRRGAVRTPSVPTGATGTLLTETYTWNPSGTMATRTNPKVSGADETWLYTYSSGANLLLSETSPLGGVRQWTYDARGNVLTERDEANHQTTYTYPASDTDPNRDLPLTATDPRGALTSYTYDTTGNPTLVVRTLNQNASDNEARTTYTYQNQTVGTATYYKALIQEKRLVSGTTWAQTDFNTDVYYANGEPKKTVYRAVALEDGGTPVDLVVTRTYDGFGSLLTQTDTSGQVTETNTYDLAGNLLTQTGPPFAATIAGQPVQTQLLTTHTYDAWGHETASSVTSTADPAQATVDTTSRTYDSAGRLSTLTRYLGAQVESVSTYRYDGLGREITAAESTQSGLPALSAYEPRGNLVAQWEGGLPSYTDDRATRHLLADGSPAYDAAGRQLRTTEPGSTSPSIQTYTADGSVARQTLSDGTYTDYLYDAAGNQTGATRSSGGTTSAVYDLGGRVTASTDENNLTTSYTYDCLDRQLTAGAAGSPASTQAYNTLGWLLRQTDADNQATTLTYDTAGRTLQETKAGQTTTSTYDAVGNLTHQVDPAGGWLDLEYDYFARTTRELQTLPGTPRVVVRDARVTYDALGRPLTWTDDPVDVDGTAVYPLNTPAATTAVVSVGTPGNDLVETMLTVTADGLETTRLSTVASSPQVPNLLRTVTSRDAGLRVTGATLATGQPTSIAAGYLYDAAGRMQRQWGTSGGGSGFTTAAETQDAYTYNVTSGLKSVDNLNLAAVGTAGTIVGSYTYTDDGRLDAATVGGVTEDDTFDAAGNLTAFTVGGTQTTLTYDSSNRLATAVTGATTTYYSFDTTQGWRTFQGPSADPQNTRFTYTGSGRLATYQNLAAGVSATYTYDAQGQRTQKTVTVGTQTTTTDFTYDGLTLLRLQATQAGGVDPTSWQLTYLYDEYGKPYAGVYRSPVASTTPTVFGLVTTDRGDVVALLDAAGSPFAAYRYDVWGNPQGAGNLATGVWSQSTSLIDSTLAAAITTRQPLRYAGYAYDQESNLYYLSARYYDPATRQFTSKDPAKADGEESAYQYAGGDPVGRVDPSGMHTSKSGAHTHLPWWAPRIYYGPRDYVGTRVLWYGTATRNGRAVFRHYTRNVGFSFLNLISANIAVAGIRQWLGIASFVGDWFGPIQKDGGWGYVKYHYYYFSYWM
ncbi:MAG: DNRLRE domain-containing protein [Thermoleophilia bacterium]